MKRTRLILLVALTVGALYVSRSALRNWYIEWSKPPVPSEQPRVTATASEPISTTTPSPRPTPLAEINLAVPFVLQAPHQVWDHDHDEFCEEAASLMAAAYLNNDQSVTDPDVADRRLYEIKAWELEHLGVFEDTSAAQTARIIHEHLKVPATQVTLIANPTVSMIKSYLAQKKLVLVPAAGQQLGNPYFRQPGPPYHMIVLKGYTKDGNFVSHDPGTRHGANYIYSIETVMSAMHDWNGGDVIHGAKVIIVIG